MKAHDILYKCILYFTSMVFVVCFRARKFKKHVMKKHGDFFALSKYLHIKGRNTAFFGMEQYLYHRIMN